MHSALQDLAGKGYSRSVPTLDLRMYQLLQVSGISSGRCLQEPSACPEMDEHDRGRHFLTTGMTRHGDYKENKSKLARVTYREINAKVFHVMFEC